MNPNDPSSFPSHNAQPNGQNPIPRQTPPRKSSGDRWLYILLGAFGVLFLSCAGILGTFVYSFQATATMSEKFAEQRSAVNAKPSETMTRFLKDPNAVDEGSLEEDTVEGTSLVQEIQDYLDNEATTEDAVDVARLVEEMRDSGEARGVNSVTGFLRRQQIQDAIQLPLGSSVVIGTEWLKPDEEVRATIVNYTYGMYGVDVYFVYLSQASGEWKIYDWRDVLAPMSEAQYFAVYTADPTAVNAYIDMTLELEEIDGNYELTSQEKAERCILAFESYSYSPSIKGQAQYILGTYLASYGDGEALKKLASRMSVDSCWASPFYRALAAKQLGERDKSFTQSMELLEEMGWHPAVALLAAESALSDEQKKQAAPYLARSAIEIPEHSESINAFVGVASESDVEEIVQHLVSIKDESRRYEHFIALVDQIGLYSGITDSEAKRILTQVQTASNKRTELELGPDYCKLIAARRGRDWPQVIELAASLMQRDELGAFEYDLSLVFEQAAFSPDMLQPAFEIAPDQEAFTISLREHLLNEWDRADWPASKKILASNSNIASETETRIALMRVELELGNHLPAFERAMELLEEHELEFKDHADNPDQDLEDFSLPPLLRWASKTVHTKQQAHQFLESVGYPRAAFFCLADSCVVRQDSELLAATLEWYETSQPDDVWADFFASYLAYLNGDWETADKRLALAVPFDDTLLESGGGLLANLVQSGSETEYTDLYTYRIRLACRLGKIDTLLAKLARSSELDELYTPDLEWVLDTIADPELNSRASKPLMEYAEPIIQLEGILLAADAACWRGDREAALALYRKAIELDFSFSDSTMYYENTFLQFVLANYPLPEVREILDSLPANSVGFETLDTLAAIQAQDKDDFLRAIRTYVDYEKDVWLEDAVYIRLLQEAGLWPTLNEAYAVDVDYFYDSERSVGELYFEDVEDFEPILQRLDISGLERLAAERFPSASEVWSGQCEEGRLLFIGYQGSPGEVDKGSPLHDKIAAYGSTLVVHLHTESGRADHSRLREIAASIGEQSGTAVAYHDFATETWFESGDWRSRLRANVSSGIDPKAPVERFLYWKMSSELPWNGSGGSLDADGSGTGEGKLPISIGIVQEMVPITPLEEAQAQAIRKNQDAPELRLYRLSADSYLYPYLKKDTIVSYAP